jgi:hypothetical protein
MSLQQSTYCWVSYECTPNFLVPHPTLKLKDHLSAACAWLFHIITNTTHIWRQSYLPCVTWGRAQASPDSYDYSLYTLLKILLNCHAVRPISACWYKHLGVEFDTGLWIFRIFTTERSGSTNTALVTAPFSVRVFVRWKVHQLFKTTFFKWYNVKSKRWGEYMIYMKEISQHHEARENCIWIRFISFFPTKYY